MNILPPPGPERTRQLGALAVLLVVLAAVWWYFYGPASGTQTVPPAAASNSATPAGLSRPVGPAGLPAPLKLASLGEDTDPATDGMTRNPFRYGQPPPPPAPKYVAPPPAPPPPPPGPPPVPEIPLQLVLLETLPGNVKTATLRDTNTSALVSGLEGQVLDGRYRLVKIGLESVVVSYLDGSGRRTLPLNR